jgi:hypothetical protein
MTNPKIREIRLQSTVLDYVHGDTIYVKSEVTNGKLWRSPRTRLISFT